MAVIAVNPTLTAIFSLNSEVPKVARALPSGRLHWHGHRPHAGSGSGTDTYTDTDSSNVARVISALIRDAECATTNQPDALQAVKAHLSQCPICLP